MKPTVTNGRGNQFIVEHTIEGLQPGSYEAIVMARNDFGWSLPSKPHIFVGGTKMIYFEINHCITKLLIY